MMMNSVTSFEHDRVYRNDNSDWARTLRQNLGTNEWKKWRKSKEIMFFYRIASAIHDTLRKKTLSSVVANPLNFLWFLFGFCAHNFQFRLINIYLLWLIFTTANTIEMYKHILLSPNIICQWKRMCCNFIVNFAFICYVYTIVCI